MPEALCNHTDDLVERAALGTLSPAEAQQLTERAATCPACRQRLAKYRTLIAAMPRLTAAAASPIVTATARGGRFQTEEETPEMNEPTLPLRPHPRPPVLPAAPRRRGAVLSTLAAAIVVAALVGAFAALGPLRAAQGSGSTSKGPTRLTGTPIHVSGQVTLGAAPASCPGAPTPRDGVQEFNGAIGQAPFWIGTFSGPHATLLLPPGGDPSTSPHGGLRAKVLVHVDDSFAATVTLTGKSLDGKTRLLFEFTTTGVTQTPAFGGSGLHRDSGYIYIPAAGCYALTASWPAGSWTLTFGAGGY